MFLLNVTKYSKLKSSIVEILIQNAMYYLNLNIVNHKFMPNSAAKFNVVRNSALTSGTKEEQSILDARSRSSKESERK